MVVAAAAAYVVNLIVTPTYTARTQLFVAANHADPSVDVAQNNQFSQDRIASYTQLLTGEQLATRVVDALGLTDTPKELAQRVTAQSLPGTVLIDVTVDDPSPQQAQQISQAIGDLFPQLVYDLETTGAETSPVVITTVDPPDLPTAPTSPNVVANVTTAGLVGLLIGMGLLIARERMDRSVKDTEQAETLSGAPAIGVVLRSHALSKDAFAQGEKDPTAKARLLAAGEDFRQIRTNLQFVGQEERPRTILVTSPLPREGKTTVVLNLALVMAETHQKVLVVEADMRQPSVSGHLGLVSGVGLSDVLTGAADIATVTQTYTKGRFSVIAAGAAPAQPGELLASTQMSDLMATLREDNDVVLVDAPSLLSVADAAALAPMMDGVLLTVRYGSTSRDQLRQAAGALRRVGARTLGVILNNTPPTADIGAAHEYREAAAQLAQAPRS